MTFFVRGLERATAHKVAFIHYHTCNFSIIVCSFVCSVMAQLWFIQDQSLISLMYPVHGQCVHLFNHSFIHSFIHSCAHSIFHHLSPTHPFTHSFINSVINSHLFIPSFIYSFIHLFVCSFNHFFTHS